ncbi:hypothetical protein HDU78_009834, partial [Chytriomyces hyalinus]
MALKPRRAATHTTKPNKTIKSSLSSQAFQPDPSDQDSDSSDDSDAPPLPKSKTSKRNDGQTHLKEPASANSVEARARFSLGDQVMMSFYRAATSLRHRNLQERNKQPTNNIQRQPKISTIFQRSEASAEPESASVKPESEPFEFNEPATDYGINSKLAVVVTAATPDGFKQFEKDTWQYAKSLLRCKQFRADSVCGSAFQTKSACGSETPFGLRLISIACKECEFRPRLRDACRNSGIEALIELSVESAKLEDHLRANYTRKQRKKAVSFIQPATKKRPIAAIESSSEEEVEDIDSEKKEKMSGSTMNLTELTKFVQDHSKRVDEFMKTINLQMEMMREQNTQLKQQMERNATLQLRI